jgi:hypothetical protein
MQIRYSAGLMLIHQQLCVNVLKRFVRGGPVPDFATNWIQHCWIALPSKSLFKKIAQRTQVQI